jgi:hypothetical protein
MTPSTIIDFYYKIDVTIIINSNKKNISRILKIQKAHFLHLIKKHTNPKIIQNFLFNKIKIYLLTIVRVKD